MADDENVIRIDGTPPHKYDPAMAEAVADQVWAEVEPELKNREDRIRELEEDVKQKIALLGSATSEVADLRARPQYNPETVARLAREIIRNRIKNFREE